VLRTYLRINRAGLVGGTRLSPEWTGKVGTAARPGSGDAVGRAAPDLLLVRRLLLESCRPGTASHRQGGGWGRVEIRSAAEQRGIGAWADPKAPGGPRPTVGTL
jgi:hypothetical protein